MTTGLQIVEDAAALILVNEDDIGLEPNEAARGVRFLNDWCAQLFESKVDFGYRPLATTSDILTSPSSVELALKQNLGVLMAPSFGLPVSVELQRLAMDSATLLKAQFRRKDRGRYPTDLPMGSGNRGGLYADPQFYPFVQPDSILRLNASSTITIATVDTPVIVDGWTVDRSVNVDAAAGGTVEYLNDEPYLATLEASLTVSASSNDQFTFYFRKNGALLEQSALIFTADAAQNILIRWVETLRRKDVISLAVENNDDTNNLTITNGHFTIT